MGEEGAKAIEGMLASASEPKEGMIATLIGIFVLLLGATTVFGELQNALDRIWRAPVQREDRQRVAAAARAAALARHDPLPRVPAHGVAGVRRGTAVARQDVGHGRVGGVRASPQPLVAFGLTTVVFAMIYKLMPRAKIEWHDVWVGAAVTAILFAVGKFLISLYIGRSAVASSFGAAGSLAVVMIWVYYSAQIFLLGAEFTWVYAHSHGSRRGRCGRATIEDEAGLRARGAGAGPRRSRAAAAPAVARSGSSAESRSSPSASPRRSARSPGEFFHASSRTEFGDGALINSGSVPEFGILPAWEVRRPSSPPSCSSSPGAPRISCMRPSRRRSSSAHVAALLGDTTAQLRKALSAPPPADLVSRIDGNLKAAKAPRDRPLADAAGVYIHGAREIVRRRGDAERLTREAAMSRRALAMHMAAASGRDTYWIRVASDLKKRVERDHHELEVSLKALSHLLHTLPETQKPLEPHVDAALLLEDAERRSARERAEASREARRGRAGEGPRPRDRRSAACGRKWWLLFAVIWVVVAAIQVAVILAFLRRTRKSPAARGAGRGAFPPSSTSLGWVWAPFAYAKSRV